MATIYEKTDNWHLVLAPDARPVQTIDEPEKGYSATVGEDPETGKHVVIDVHYNKDRYTLDNVRKFVEKSRNCTQCAALDKKKLELDSIELQEPVKELRPQETGLRTMEAPGESLLPTRPEASAKQATSPLKDIFANVFFDAYLTTPGKYFLGMMLNDDRILESAMPKDSSGIPQFMDEMVDFLAGRIDFVRSPDEVKEYLSVLKKDDNDNAFQTSRRGGQKKRRPGATTMLIY